MASYGGSSGVVGLRRVEARSERIQARLHKKGYATMEHLCCTLHSRTGNNPSSKPRSMSRMRCMSRVCLNCSLPLAPSTATNRDGLRMMWHSLWLVRWLTVPVCLCPGVYCLHGAAERPCPAVPATQGGAVRQRLLPQHACTCCMLLQTA